MLTHPRRISWPVAGHATAKYWHAGRERAFGLAVETNHPDVPADRAFIEKYSGYQNLKAGVKYPEPYITTNTRDDRVHPGHPRKFAAKMEGMGLPYLYYEQTFGGHANDADPELNARRWARHYVYLSQTLMDGSD